MEWNDQKNNANKQGGRKQEAGSRRQEVGGTPVGYLQNGWGTELVSSKKQLQLGGQSGTWTCSLRISSPVPWPLRYAASLYQLLTTTLFNSHIVWFQKSPYPPHCDLLEIPRRRRNLKSLNVLKESTNINWDFWRDGDKGWNWKPSTGGGMDVFWNDTKLLW